MTSHHALLVKAATPTPPLSEPPTRLSELHAADLTALRKDAAYRVGWRSGLAERTASLIENPAIAAGVRAQILAAPDDKAALVIAHKANQEEADRLERLVKPQTDALRHLNRVREAYEDVADWLVGPLTLGAAAASQLHKVGPDNVLCMSFETEFRPPEVSGAHEGHTGVLLVQHDWASLLANADVDEGVYRLPFDLCCFEFSISERHVCALVACRDGEPYRLVPLIRARGGWLILFSYALSGGEMSPEMAPEFAGKAEPPATRLGEVIMAQVRAIAITLDAEVLTRELVRAPHRLNAARLKRRERPIYDHHILTLSRQPRPAPLPHSGHAGHRKRLHFRRGHWRHYPNHKTWIRWCLVGDPSLGFADKDYRL